MIGDLAPQFGYGIQVCHHSTTFRLSCYLCGVFDKKYVWQGLHGPPGLLLQRLPVQLSQRAVHTVLLDDPGLLQEHVSRDLRPIKPSRHQEDEQATKPGQCSSSPTPGHGRHSCSCVSCTRVHTTGDHATSFLCTAMIFSECTYILCIFL